MTLANGLTIIGWIVGPLIAASINYVLKQETKVVTWFATEAIFFRDAGYANQVGNLMGARIQVLIDGQETTGVSYLSVYVANKGGKKLKNLRLVFAFPDAIVYKYRWTIDAIYSNNLKPGKDWRDAVELEVSYMDKHQAFQGNFLLAQYTPGTATVKATSSEDEIKLERYEASSHQFKDGLNSLLLIASAILLGFLFSSVLPLIADYLAPIQQSQ
jgi:hypothetical protein